MGGSIQQKRGFSDVVITVAPLFSTGMLWQAGSPELWKSGQQENSGLVMVPTKTVRYPGPLVAEGDDDKRLE